jgi:histidine triad (HIT) family protein
MKMGFKTPLAVAVSLLIGILVGGYVFSDTTPRPILAFRSCKTSCLNKKELIGLIASVGIQKLPQAIPHVVLETDKTLVIRHPFPEARIHYVLIPKRDIRNIAEVSEADAPFLMDLFSTVGELVRRDHLTSYRVFTNGPGYQQMTYLHFHLVAK